MDIIINANKHLNGNHHLLNIIFSYLGQSPSAKVLNELIDDEYIQHSYTNSWLMRCELFSPQYFFSRHISSLMCKTKKYTPFDIPRYKVDVLGIEDDVDCERCYKLLTYTERDFYDGYCEACYDKVHHLGDDEYINDLDTDTDEDEDEDEGTI